MADLRTVSDRYTIKSGVEARFGVYLIPRDGIFKTGIAIRIQVIGPYKYPFLPRWYSEWSNTGHNITDCLSLLEDVHYPFMFRYQSGTPVDLRVVESKCATEQFGLNIQGRITGEEFISKSAKLVVCANIADLVDYSFDWGILVEQNISNDVLVLKKLIAQVEMG